MKKIFSLFAAIYFLPISAFAQVIDVHSHIIPNEYTDFLREHNAELQETFPLPKWNKKAHLDFMESMGIDYSVLSLPAPQPYFGNNNESADMVRKLNELSAKVRDENPDKFKFLATLPLPDVKAAIKEAQYAFDVLHADGIKLATNSYGQYLGDEELDELMAVLNKYNAVIFVHPHRPEPYAEKIIRTTPLAMYEYPAETTRAIVNMISRNVLAKYPNIKVIIPHCGSFLPLAIPRMKAIFPAMKAKGLMQNIDWEKNLAALYYDLAGVPTTDLIKTMLSITTPEHILYGSDYPYQPNEILEKNLENLRYELANDEDLAPYAEKFLQTNAQQLFEREDNK
ncbi:MAG: amidohydrolase [Alphaproteobacteria bacterium]|nr:amidohydrolase [Alphaproteobacteria bacterium]